MSSIRNLLIVATLCLTMSGCQACTEEVPAGMKGQVKNPGGWSGELVHPGWVSCWGRDVLWLVEGREETKEVPLNILLQQEKVNFGITIAITYTLKDDKETVLPLFDKVAPDSSQGSDNVKFITLSGVYKVYAEPVMKSVPRQLVRNYTTDTLLTDSAKIEAEIQSRVIEELKNTPLLVRRVAVTNMDFPKFITEAQEKAKMAEIQIREEVNKQKRRLIEAENKKKIEELEVQTLMIEAKGISDRNKLIGSSLMGEKGKAFLRYHELRVYQQIVNSSNKVIFLPMSLSGGSRSNLAHEAAMTPIRKELRKAIDGE